MRYKIIFSLLVLLFSSENCSPSDNDSLNIHHSRYFCGSTISSYGPLIIAGAISLLSKDKEENGHSNYDNVPDIIRFAMIYQFGFGSYLSLSSILGLTIVGHQKKQIITKCLLYDLGIIVLTAPFYVIPPCGPLIPILGVFAIPIINFNIAYSIDENYFQKKMGKISLQPYCGFNKSIKKIGVLISF